MSIQRRAPRTHGAIQPRLNMLGEDEGVQPRPKRDERRDLGQVGLGTDTDAVERRLLSSQLWIRRLQLDQIPSRSRVSLPI